MLENLKKQLQRNPFKDQKGNVVLFQRPNWLIWSAALANTVQFILPDGKLQSITKATFTIFLIMWAYEELVRGDSLFRRLLGLSVLILTTISMSKLYS